MGEEYRIGLIKLLIIYNMVSAGEERTNYGGMMHPTNPQLLRGSSLWLGFQKPFLCE